jgi:tetratricopeptide (TPR) repeat protein
MGWLIYQRDQDVVTAVAQFDTAIAVDPQSGAGQAAMGSLFTQRKQYDIAAEWYRVAYQQNRDNPSYGLSYANALYSDGRTEQAIAEYQNLTARFPDYASAYYQLAWIYHQEGQSEQAITAIETALSLSEGPDLSFILRANTIYQSNQLTGKALDLYRSTETAFEEIIEAFPDFPEPYLNIARFYEEYNRNESAITAYRQTLAVDPENTLAAEALDRLQEGE